MQEDKSITFPKFPGASYGDNIFADNNDEMEGSDKIWYWCVIYYALMLICCCCHQWWYIIFNYYCCYASLISIVYWWYLTKHSLVSNCNTGWTHLYGTHHDHHAEWFIMSSCLHFYTLNVKWYYMQGMCWGIYLYYHLLIKTRSYLRFLSVGSKVFCMLYTDF